MEVKPKIVSELLEQITKDRNGESCSWDLLKAAVNSFVELGLAQPSIIKVGDEYRWAGDRNLDLYNVHIADAVVKGAEKEYQQKSMGWISSLNCPEYLQIVESNLLKEEERADYFLQPETKSKLISVCEKQLVEQHAEILVSKDTGCDSMF